MKKDCFCIFRTILHMAIDLYQFNKIFLTKQGVIKKYFTLL